MTVDKTDKLNIEVVVKERNVQYSKTIMTELIMPNDTNPLGNLMGGNLMRWMDIAGGICAAKHCGAHVVTASVDHVTFRRPISLGDVIMITATVTRAFNTSVEVYLEVTSSNIIGGDAEKSNHAYMSFVALNNRTMRPKRIPKVVPKTDKEKELFEGLIEQFKIYQSELSIPLRENLARSLAKRASIKSGQKLQKEDCPPS